MSFQKSRLHFCNRENKIEQHQCPLRRKGVLICRKKYWSQHEIAVLELVKFLHALSTAISDFYNMSEYSI